MADKKEESVIMDEETTKDTDVVEEETTNDLDSTENTQENNDCNKSSDEKSELDKANEQIRGLSDKLMRKAAEFDNFKKRTAKEKEDFYKMAVCETVTPLLAVLDNLERAVDAAEAAGESGSVLDGIKMVKKQFDDALLNLGVAPIEALGNEFDPEKHNAVMTGESDETENIVIEEFQKGYIYKDKVVRHSMVKVSK